MKELLNKLRDGHDIIFKGLLLLVSLVTIVYFLPKEAKFQYEFQVGKPWLHENLLAPYDFAIYKSDQEMQEERETVTRNSQYFFDQEEIVGEEALRQFEKDLVSRLDTSRKKERKIYNRLLPIGRSALAHIYKRGIVKPVSEIEDLEEDQLVVISRDNLGQEKVLGDLYTISSVLEYLKSQYNRIDDDEQRQLLKDLLIRNMSHNVFYDAEKTEAVLQERIEAISPTRGKVEKDELIISRGNVVTEPLYQRLESLKREYLKRKGGAGSQYYIAAGQILLVGMILLVLVLFLSIFRQHIINVSNRVFFILVTFTLIVLMGTIPLYIEQVPIYVLPFCLLPILIKAFYDEILAAFIHVLAMILIGFVAPNGYEFVFLQSMAGLIAIFSLVTVRKRSQLITTTLVIFVTYVASDLALLIVQEGDWHNIEWQNMYWFAGSAILTLLVYPLIYLFEKLFGFLSDVTLMELADTNSKLLRELATRAPGTFQHSMQVANLSERAILNIGGDPLLVRTGALYHDIGKMKQPHYFIENQVGGVNPHDELAPEESAEIILDHVLEGIELAKKSRLPEVIIDFIRTHHGTSQVKYFLYQYQQAHPDEEIDLSRFSYRGPIPFSKETAVLMMADACEAASRSLPNYSVESIGKLVNGIIDSQADQGQFANADITFKDISTIKKIFTKMLLNIYHVRIEYPKD
ncbi:HDIG domain-containing protein [bacterium SCSIO 12741]|nr:HDIG domain-containing protein [bacterium SCSIO 12741]